MSGNGTARTFRHHHQPHRSIASTTRNRAFCHPLKRLRRSQEPKHLLHRRTHHFQKTTDYSPGYTTGDQFI